MRMLLLDAETLPGMYLSFQTKKVYLDNAKRIVEPRMACFAYRWYGDDETHFASEWEIGQDGLAVTLWDLLDEADAVVHYNGISFDDKWARTTMMTNGLTHPPSPWKDVDLFKASLQFALPSYKLEYVSTRLIPTEGKMPNSGFDLWKAVYFGDEEARAQMEKYNIQDVDVMIPVFEALLPWLKGFPSTALHDDDHDAQVGGKVAQLPHRCRCGSANLVKRGYAFTGQTKFQRYRCTDCGSWSRDTKPIARISLVEVR